MRQENAELLEAANRTTHAVRAIGLFLIIEVAFSVVSAAIIGMAYAASDGAPVPGFLWTGGVLGVVGLAIALVAGARELDRSKPPAVPSARPALRESIAPATPAGPAAPSLSAEDVERWRAIGSPALDTWDGDPDTFDAWLAWAARRPKPSPASAQDPSTRGAERARSPGEGRCAATPPES